jgi:cell division protein FtsQ
MSNRIVGNYRSARARGASVSTPKRDQQHWFASFGRVMLAVFGLGLTVVIGFGVKEAFVRVNTQKINTVQIEGSLNFLSRTELEETVNRFVETSLVALDLDLLKQELEGKPWVNSAEVRRQWPDRLIIRIEEEVAIARWGNGQLLNQQGHVFAPEDIEEQMQLPYLSGPENSESLVMLQYLEFNQLLYPLGIRIRDLELNERGAWTITFTNAAQAASQVSVKVKVGREEVLDRLKRLVTFLESQTAEELLLVETIDLRYANGLAISHRSPESLPRNSGGKSGTDEVVAR